MRRIAVLISLSILFSSSGASAGEFDARWIPALSITAGIRSIDTQASSSSIRSDISSESRAFFGHLGVDAEIASPVLFEHATAPRIFLRGGYATSFDGEERIANEGAPGAIEIPIVDNNNDGIPDAPTPVGAIKGLGSATAAESRSPIWSAAIGVDLGFDAFERRFHVRPSFEWIRQRDRVKAIFGFGEKFPLVGNDDECPCRTVSASGEKTETYHGIGPGLEISVDAGRFHSIVATVFAGGQAYFNLNRTIEINATGTFDDNSSTQTLRATYERDLVDYRVAWGVRFHWAPE